MSHNLRSIMVYKGYTIISLAEALEINESTLRRKVNGTTKLTKDDIISISKLLGLNSHEAAQIFLPELCNNSTS